MNAAEEVIMALRREAECSECHTVVLIETMHDGACAPCWESYQSYLQRQWDEEQWRLEQEDMERRRLEVSCDPY